MKFFNIEIDSNRIFGLDILRALAILFVIYQHAGNYLPTSLKSVYNLFIFDGVSIFFVLSGFLIGKILIQLFTKHDFNRRDLLIFWNRRWLRTLPNYFLVLILLMLLNSIFNSAFSLSNVSRYFIFSQNLSSPHPQFFPEAWSLSIEEWFYFIIPICLFILIKFLKLNANKAILITIVSIIILITFFRYYKFTNYNISSYADWDLLLRKQVLTRLDSIMYGVLGSYFFCNHATKWIKYKTKFFYLGILLLISSKILNLLNLKPTTGIFNCVFSFSIFSIGVLMIIPYLSGIKKGKGFISSVISMTSLISYSMYILHLSIIQFWIIDKINWMDFSSNPQFLIIIKYLLFWILTFVCSHFVYKYFELPIMKLRVKQT